MTDFWRRSPLTRKAYSSTLPFYFKLFFVSNFFLNDWTVEQKCNVPCALYLYYFPNHFLYVLLHMNSKACALYLLIFLYHFLYVLTHMSSKSEIYWQCTLYHLLVYFLYIIFSIYLRNFLFKILFYKYISTVKVKCLAMLSFTTSSRNYPCGNTLCLHKRNLSEILFNRIFLILYRLCL